MTLYDATGTEQLIESGRLAKQLPEPVGFNMLIALPEVKEKTEGGIIRPDELRQREETAAVVGFVVKQGPDCYKNKQMFDGPPWCKEGDWVIFRPYTGIRLLVHGKEFRLLRDNEISAVVENPAGVIRSHRM